MGRMKDSLLEDQALTRAEAAFLCPICGEHSVSQLDVPKLYADTSFPSKLMTHLQCNSCDELLAVHVVGTEDHYNAQFYEYETDIIIHPFVRLQIGEIEDWSLNQIPDDTKAVFLTSYNEADSLLTTFGQETGDGLMNKMIFTQSFSSFEAYLSDTLVKNVLGSVTILQKFIERNDDLRKKNFPIKDILSVGSKTCLDLIKSIVSDYLKSIQYHNLPKVDFLYKSAFDISIFSDRNLEALLCKAVYLRHDCVHRNGHEKDGKRHRIFTKHYVRQVAEAMLATVNHVDEQMSEIKMQWASNPVSPLEASPDLDAPIL